jgi:tRNA threonylcarbamoyladenosine biosynthesis protein TsaB
MALAAMAETGAPAAAVLHDARRGEVYFTLVARDRTILPDRLVSFEEALDEIRANNVGGRLVLAGSGATDAMAALEGPGEIVQAPIVAPDALWVARLAVTAPEPMTIPLPLYLRPPDARLPTAAP